MEYKNLKDCEAVCNGVCNRVRKFGREDVYYDCVNYAAYYFCHGGIPSYWALSSILAILNLLIYCIARIRGSYFSTAWKLISSIVQNFMVGLIIMGIVCITRLDEFEPQFLASIVFPSVVTIIMSTVSYQLSKCSMLEKRADDDSHDENEDNDINTFISKCHYNPPIIKLEGVCVKSDYDMEYVDYVPYQSWKSESEPGEEIKSSFFVVETENEFVLSKKLESDLSEKENYIKGLATQIDATFKQDDVTYDVYNVKKRKIFGHSRYFNFMNSKPGEVVYVILHFLGFAAAFENMLGVLLKKVVIKTRRVLSDSNDLPIPANAPDPKGIGCEANMQNMKSCIPMRSYITGPKNIDMTCQQQMLMMQQLMNTPGGQMYMQQQMQRMQAAQPQRDVLNQQLFEPQEIVQPAFPQEQIQPMIPMPLKPETEESNPYNDSSNVQPQNPPN